MLYIVIILILLYSLLFHIQWKLRSCFWSKMPMLFYHKMYLLLCHSNRNILDINTLYSPKLTNHYNITTKPFYMDTFTDTQQFELLNFIKHHTRYYNSSLSFSNEIIRNPNIFLSQYNGTNSYLSTYHSTKREGVLCNKSYEISIDNRTIKTSLFMFLSVNSKKDTQQKKKITTQLLYNGTMVVMKQTTQNCIFTTSRKITNVIPLVTYNDFIFDITYFSHQPYDKLYKLTKITTSNFNLLNSLFEKKPELFQVYLLPEVSNIFEMIQYDNLHIFTVNHKNDISCLYVFKNNLMLYNGKKIFTLISSICIEEDHTILFMNNLYNCIDYLKKNETIEYISISNTSHNTKLLKGVKIKYKEVCKQQQYWYMINYILAPVKSNDVFLLY